MEDSSTRPLFGRRLPGGMLAAAALVVTAAAALAFYEAGDSSSRPPVAAISVEQAAPPVPDRSPSDPPVVRSQTGTSDEVPASSLAERLVGVWHLEKHGSRTLSLYADGTATADVRLNMLGALLYGEQMQLQLEWTLDGDVMTQTISSGSPPEAVERLIRDWGDRREYRVIDVSDEQLVLSEIGDEADRQVWSSIAAESMSTATETKQSPR